ncbi:MAG: hypothetical protein ABI682_15140 [Acidobacteriota bacterium]
MSAQKVLAVPVENRILRAIELALEEPEVLLSLCGAVREFLDSAPATAHSEATFFYSYVKSPPRSVGLFDEREYFLGEFALIAGTACRQLSFRDEARLWFDRSEAAFRASVNSVADLSRLSYQRLALRLEERQLEAVLELVPGLVDSFNRLGMRQDELKARFLEGLALMESERLTESIETFEEICRIAAEIKAERLLASAYGNLTHIYGILGDPAKAISASQQAIPTLTRLNDRVALAKVQWGLAVLLRECGQINDSIEAYLASQREFASIGMRADVAALNLVLADLYLEQGREEIALRCVLSALPIIDELGMVPEGMAAMALLRESVRQQRVNRTALRDLHGFFDGLTDRQ